MGMMVTAGTMGRTGQDGTRQESFFEVDVDVRWQDSGVFKR